MFSRLGFRYSYIWGLVFLRFKISNSYVWELVFLRLRVRVRVRGLIFLHLGVSFLTFLG